MGKKPRKLSNVEAWAFVGLMLAAEAPLERRNRGRPRGSKTKQRKKTKKTHEADMGIVTEAARKLTAHMEIVSEVMRKFAERGRRGDDDILQELPDRSVDDILKETLEEPGRKEKLPDRSAGRNLKR